MKAKKSASVASTVFKRVIRQLRDELEETGTRRSDLAGMERAIQLLLVVMILACAAIIVVYTQYSTTLKAYCSLIEAQGNVMTMSRMSALGLFMATLYNNGIT